MRVVPVIEGLVVLRKTLKRAKLWREPEPRHPPPVPALIDIECQPFLEG